MTPVATALHGSCQTGGVTSQNSLYNKSLAIHTARIRYKNTKQVCNKCSIEKIVLLNLRKYIVLRSKLF